MNLFNLRNFQKIHEGYVNIEEAFYQGVSVEELFVECSSKKTPLFLLFASNLNEYHYTQQKGAIK